jgi:hypothetical protein
MNARELLKLGALVLAVGGLVAMMVLGLSARSALADSEIGSPGTGAGQTSDPRSVAVDEAEGLLYVADRGNNRIDVFDASSGAFVRAFGWGVLNGASELQVCTVACLPGISGSGSGQLKTLAGIAVDNDSGSPGFHSVYVFDAGNRRVQKFSPGGAFIWMVGDGVNVTTGGDLCTSASGNVCGAGTGGNAPGQFEAPGGDTIEVGPGGTIYVGDRVFSGEISQTRVQLYDPAGSYLGYLGGKLLAETGATRGVAVDSGGSLYVASAGNAAAVRKYDSSGNELDVFNESLNLTAVAVGPDDHVFVGENLLEAPFGEISTIFEYDTSGALLRAFYGSLVGPVSGLAVYPNPNGDIFAVEATPANRILNIEFPAPGPVIYPKPSTLFANPVGSTKATLNARVNPEGEATTYHFEYISDEDFKASGEKFGAGTLKTPEKPLGASDFKLHSVQEQIANLFPETLYHFRLVATNSSGTNPSQEDEGPIGEFQTTVTVVFGEAWSTDVGVQTATLHAEVNPQGLSATARFQYTELSDTTYANAKEAPAPPAEPIDLGEGETMEAVSTPISGLAEGTAYRYRLLVTNRCKPEPAPLCKFAEVEGIFTTFITLTPTTDCPNAAVREKGSGQFLPDCRGYEMVSPVDKNGANIEPVFNVSGFPAGLDQAAVDGSSITYSSYKAFADPESSPYTSQYLARRGAGGWQSEAISPVREGAPLMTYLSSQLDRQYKAFSEDLCSGWVVQDANPILASGGIEAYPGLYRRHNCAPETGSYEALTTLEPPATEPPNLPPRRFIPEMQGASADSSVAVFAVNDNLVAGMPAQPQACVDNVNPSAETCERRLYESRGGELHNVCVLPGGAPFSGACSAGAGGPLESAGRAGSLNNAVSADGSRIFWSAAEEGPASLYVRINGTETVSVSASSSTRFLSASANGSKAVYSVNDKLFEFDIDTETETQVAEGFIGMAGASEDASRIFFASSKVLTGEEENSEGDKAEAGKANLYFYEAGVGFKFVGVLPAADSGPADTSPISRLPSRHLSRVTPDGEQLVFMSRGSLTGYDNRDAISEQPDFEVYLYEAVEEQLLCVSCNPSNARPEGRELTQKLLEDRWAAARIPVYESQLYGSRVIADGGNRLYFNSYEALSSRDVNGKEDAYQWQAPGSGSCTTSSPTYHEVSGGCVDLISSGQSPEDSEFVDASADGSDVFFKTYESLVDQDPTRMDVYDARVDGGFAGLPDPPIICQGEGCQAPPQIPPVAVAPATRAAGPGNPAWPQPKPKARKCPKGKHKVKAKNGKVRCVKNKKKKSQSKKRASTTRRAGR